MILSFLNRFYEHALILSEAFSETRDKNWGPLVILNELGVQIGQIYNIIYHNEEVSEKGRVFNNLGDELSDVLLQLIALAHSMNIDFFEIRNFQNVLEMNWMSLPIIFGQLNESIMEKYGYRFLKPRKGYDSIDSFIKNRLFLLFSITFQIANFHGLDMEQEFQEMIVDATGFLSRFKKENTMFA
ncbi:MAG: hypothetical protein HFI09_03030 [Bacilli bacterium]|nr:hypothetical protein [Bacilli bacterium]